MKQCIVFLFFLLLLAGCTTSYESRYKSSNRFMERGYSDCPCCGRDNIYSNDSLKISMFLAGDFSISDGNNFIVKKSFRLYRRLLENGFSGLKVSKMNFVFQSSTNVGKVEKGAVCFEPGVNATVFCFPLNERISPSVKVDSVHNTSMRLIRGENKDYILVCTLQQLYGHTFRDLCPILKMGLNHLSGTLVSGDKYVRAESPDPFTRLHCSFGDSASYFFPLWSLKGLENNYYTDADKQLYLKSALTYNSFVQNNSGMIEYLSRYYHSKDRKLKIHLYDEAAIDYIKEQIVGKQVVMVDEQGWQPRHRALGNKLLIDLYDQGYRYLAVGGIQENEDSLNLRRFPLQTSNFFCKESQFGSLIRNALGLGFKIISYDNSLKGSEYSQMKEIYDKTLKKDPMAKVLVWVGGERLCMDEIDYSMMAKSFKEISGVSPYTIEQTAGDVKAPFLKEHWLAIKSDTAKDSPCNLYLYNDIKESDYQVKPGIRHHNLSIPLSQKVKDKMKQHNGLLLMVFLKDEFSRHRFNAVPVLNYLVKNDVDPTIHLPNGDYTVIFRSPTSYVVEESVLKINN